MKIFVAVLLSCAALAVSAREIRITNQGETASPGEFPYQVSFTVNGGHYCGGALISKKHVLTAAHCVQKYVTNGRPSVPLAIEVGSVVLGRGRSHAIKRIAYRQGFTDRSNVFLPNDIAVIHLKTEVQLNQNVGIIGLPAPNSELRDGTTVIVSGFGQETAQGPISRVLKKLVTKTVSVQTCQRFYSRVIQNTNICASRGPGYGTCPGDSGGPMVDANKQTIVGVVSGGNGRCGSGDPDIYTKVSHFMSFVREELQIDASRAVPPGANPAIDLDPSSNIRNPGGSRPPVTYPPQNPPKNQGSNCREVTYWGIKGPSNGKPVIECT